MNILVSFPLDPGNMYIHKKVSMVQWELARDRRYNLFPMWPSHRPYENNLNLIVKDFVKSNCDFWLNMDADNPPVNNPLDLVVLDKDIIGLPTPVWHFTGELEKERPIYWNGYDYILEEDAYTEHNPKEGLQRVDAIGTGCFLISRRVFENPDMLKAPFMRQWKEDGTVYKGNDISFCEKARAAGFEIFCHYDYPCDHFSEAGWNEVIRGFKNLYGDKE